MRPQVNLSPHLVGMVRMRESLIGHSVSLLVLMVLYTCVTMAFYSDFRGGI